MKYIIVTGGVLSGLGKGITAASIGRMLKNRGYKVTVIKIDPYINIDAGTMNPFQHGEVYVLKDGGEADLDLGHYERFLNVELTSDHNITTGKVYLSVIQQERRGGFLGKTVQIIPHITDEIKREIREVAKKSDSDVCIVEIGGTVGDIEGMPFLEAIRQMRREEKKENLILVHVTLVPINNIGEQKTKPTQHSVKELKSLGLQPDVIIGRCRDSLSEETKSKISLFCDVPEPAVISNYDAKDIYLVPEMLEREELGEYLVKKLKLDGRKVDTRWYKRIKAYNEVNKDSIKIALVGKYGLEDAYLSVKEALKHACIREDYNHKIEIRWVEAEDLEESANLDEYLKEMHGILVPGGFGVRGTKGKIDAIRYARERDIPFLGICLGFQLSVIEFARDVLKINAKSREFEEFNSPAVEDQTAQKSSICVIDLLPEQREIKDLGGTMRLGDQEIDIEKNSLAYELYTKDKIRERHRHRYEVNPDYIEVFEENGVKFSGKNGERMEILEIPGNRFFIATQFHPEFRSSLDEPAPAFLGFVRAMIDFKKDQKS